MGQTNREHCNTLNVRRDNYPCDLHHFSSLSDIDFYVFLYAPTYQYKTLSLYVLKHLFRRIIQLKHFFPACNYMFKVNNINTRTKCEICSKLTIKTPEQYQWCRSGVFSVNFEHISYHALVFLLLLTLRR